MKRSVRFRKMKKVLSAMLLSGLLTFSAASAAELPAQSRENLDCELEDMVGYTGTKVPGLGVIVYKDGEEIYSRFMGRRYIDSENPAKDLPVTRDTRFRVASVSKHFTIFTIMQLVEQGKLDLDADASKYLGFSLRNPNYPDTPITVRMLASHTSSLRDGKVYSLAPELSVKEFFSPTGKNWENGAHFAPKGEDPGEFFCYANLNYGLLGTIIECVTGERFDKYQKNHILKQLDIKADYLPGGLGKKEFSRLGTLYRKGKDGAWNERGPWQASMYDFKGTRPGKDYVFLQNPYEEQGQRAVSLSGYRVGTNATFFSPQGGLCISYDELGHLLEMLMNGGVYRGQRIVRQDLLEEMFRPQWVYDATKNNGNDYGGSLPCYGMGEYVMGGDSTARPCKDLNITLAGHLGEAYGLFSGVLLIPGTKDGFIYMMNGEAVEEDEDARSAGKYSGNYIWEEHVMDAVCRNAFPERAGEPTATK